MTHRPKLPFRVSRKAVEHIRQWSHPKRSFRVTIMLVYADIESDEHGNVIARFDGEHLLVGYHKPHQVAKWPRFEIGGHLIAICPDTLARLVGKRLTLSKKVGHSPICPYVLVES